MMSMNHDNEQHGNITHSSSSDTHNLVVYNKSLIRLKTSKGEKACLILKLSQLSSKNMNLGEYNQNFQEPLKSPL